MIIINFSHPLTEEHLDQVESLTKQEVEQVISLPVQFENGQPFLPQLQALIENIPLRPDELQTKTILVNPPALNFITAVLLADLHGRMGFFPPILRMRPVVDNITQRYKVAEVLNLQGLRDDARKRRHLDYP